MTIRIALLGGPSAGKSTLAARVFADLKEEKIITELVQEYAREHINKYGKISNILSQYLIYEKQKEKEDIIPSRVQVVITDSPTILSYIYGLYYYDPSNVDHQQMVIEMYRKIINDIKRYDLIFYLEPTRPYVQDGTRTQTAEEAKEIGEMVVQFLELHGIEYETLDMPETEMRSHIIKSRVREKLKIEVIRIKNCYYSDSTKDYDPYFGEKGKNHQSPG